MDYQTILLAIGVVIIVLLLREKTREKVVGICATAIGMDTKKQERKEKILELLRKQGGLSPSDSLGVSNSDIREALGISDRSVIRYMDELEQEGKVEQVGTTGRSVTYHLIP